MDRLWAPWRLAYVKCDPAERPANFIVHADQSGDDRAHLVIDRTELSIIILNRFPYSNGHTLVAPRRQVGDLTELTEAELLDNQIQLQRIMTAMKMFLKPQGFNVGLNLERAAGAGLPVHLHWHVVPRWFGDVNFMTILGDTRIIIQSLDELWLQLRRAMNLPVPEEPTSGPEVL